MERSHVGEVDYLRVIGLVSIVFIHAFGFYLAMPVSGPAVRVFQQLFVELLRFGRYIFMFVTGVVLFYSYNKRELNVTSFFKRRLNNLVIPYVVWTAIYLLMKNSGGMIKWPNVGAFAISWAINLLNGNAYIHLYYIIVSIQFYLLFPLALRFFRPRRPGLVAGIILTAGLFLFVVYYFGFEAHPSRAAAMGGLSWLVDYKDRIIVSYLPFYLLGALVGLHLEETCRWLREHTVLIGAGLTLGLGLMMMQYFYLYRHLGESWAMTVSVFNPGMYVYSLAVIAACFRLALWWERRRTWRPLVTVLAANSLGIYLVHPAVLYFIHSYLWRYQNLPGTILVILDLAAAVALSYLVSRLLGAGRYTRFVVGVAGGLSGRRGRVGISVRAGTTTI